MHYLDLIVSSHRYPPARGIPSVCSAHPYVIEATLRHGLTLPGQTPVLIESKCKQVNQEGGYTGMTPPDFVAFVQDIAARVGFPRERILLGGDHLGPLPWAHLPPEQAMEKARTLVAAYVRAGYTKIHLDCSMPLGGERDLPLEVIAERTADLAQVAEAARPEGTTLRYVVGSEVPPAGGAKGGRHSVEVTPPEEIEATLEAMRRAFQARGLDRAWQHVVAIVVQPGVEFGNDFVHDYDPAAARGLARFIEHVPGLVYEAHSTDYQTGEALRALVEDHFAILKVGPALTFAFREAVFALAAIEEELGLPEPSRIRDVLEQVMVERPDHWRKYYPGTPEEQRLARAFSFSDRVRYYWPDPRVQAALTRLLDNLSRRAIPLSLLSQYLPLEYRRVRAGHISPRPRDLILAHIEDVLENYRIACMDTSGRVPAEPATLRRWKKPLERAAAIR